MPSNGRTFLKFLIWCLPFIGLRCTENLSIWASAQFVHLIATESYHKVIEERISDYMSTNSYLHLSWERARLVGNVKHIGYIVRVFLGWSLAAGWEYYYANIWLVALIRAWCWVIELRVPASCWRNLLASPPPTLIKICTWHVSVVVW